VATLVVRGAAPSEVLWAVTRELGRLLDADYAWVSRFECGHTECHLADWHDPDLPSIGVPFGGRWPMWNDIVLADMYAEMYHTGGPVRRTYTSASIPSAVGDWLEFRGIGQVVTCPIIVGGLIWGKVAVGLLGSRTAPNDIEERMGQFVELVACTIAQAEYRAELISSRARLVTASDETRRRIERDLHDGAQQRLIALGLALREAEENAPGEDDALRRSLSNAASYLSEALAQLQEISRGLHPAILKQKGLGAAIKGLTRRSPVPTEVRIGIDQRLPDRIEIIVYYVVSEALTNVLKHADASNVHIDLSRNEQGVRLAIRDDGVGGADLRGGTGLIGLKDRVEAVEGTIEMSSPIGGGTALLIDIPPHALEEP
jgi:signal transduction histidine kinase